MVELPARVGRYRIEAVIGAGGFATVYRARDERLDDTVAVKVLAENHCLDPDVRERFLQEGRVLRHIDSRHVVTVHDLGETERGQPYLVLDHADRGDLATRVAARTAAGWRPTTDDVLAIAGALADALTAVHASHIVRRDLAPGNLLLRSTRLPDATRRAAGVVDPDEQLVLADLGLSKDLGIASGLTAAGGTAGFTPPEQRRVPGRVDQRADLWAASAVVLWLALGRPPDDEGAWASELAHLGWPGALVDALGAGLSEDPGGRPGTAAAWHRSIEQALAPPVPAQPPDADRHRSPDDEVGPRRRSLPILLVVVALVVGAALGAMVGRSTAPSDERDSVVSELDGGRRRAVVTEADRRVEIIGPAAIGVGETATFEGSTTGMATMTWIGPDGGVHPDIADLDVTTSSAGRATVRLIGVDAEGGTLQAELDLQVVER